MASCDDDFSLLADADDHHHHIHHHHHQQPHFIHSRNSESDVVFCSPHDSNPYEPDFDPDPDPNPSNATVPTTPATEKRKDHDDLSDTSSYKKIKPAGGSVGVAGAVGGEYRKDREEWSDSAIDCLLDAYTDKYTQLNRGNLRGRDWEEVAVIVGERCENQSKTVEQCKNKVDNLKKRYKLERHRMSSAGILVSHWPWFKKMEVIVGNSVPAKGVSDEEKVSGGSSGSAGRHQKRYSAGTAGPPGHVVKSKSLPNSKWQRVVFKISGAALAGNGPHNVDPKVVMLIAREVAIAYRLGVQVAIVIGGRNFFCGDEWITATGADRYSTYQIGMMATLMNAVLLQSALEKMGVQTRLQTAFALPEVGELYNRQRAIRHLEKGRIVIFGGVGGGSGNPVFSTDTTAVLRATDINAHAVLKGTSVDSFYEHSSRNNGTTFEHISFRGASSRGPACMDLMALTLCEENRLPVVVFNLLEPGNISRAICGEQIGTLIDQTAIIN